MDGVFALIGGVLYGTGMRLMEGLHLRVADLDFGHRGIVVRDGKGAMDRMVPLPRRYEAQLQAHLKEVEALHAEDLAGGGLGHGFDQL